MTNDAERPQEAPQDAETDDAPQSYILVNFAGPGSAELTLEMVNVTPVQIFGVLPILEMNARAAMTGVEKPTTHLAVARSLDMLRDHRRKN